MACYTSAINGEMPKAECAIHLLCSYTQLIPYFLHISAGNQNLIAEGGLLPVRRSQEAVFMRN